MVMFYSVFVCLSIWAFDYAKSIILCLGLSKKKKQ